LHDLAQRHSRADHASKGGAGLGLAIVERIMTAHDGVLTTDPGAHELTLWFPDTS
jgi:signal transduction histidine kinase